MLLTRFVDAGGRFIEQQYIWSADQGKPDQSSLEVPTREMAHRRCQHLCCQAYTRRNLLDLVSRYLQNSTLRIEEICVRQREVSIGIDLLRDIPDPRCWIPDNLARIRNKPEQGLQQYRLACPVWTHNAQSVIRS